MKIICPNCDAEYEMQIIQTNSIGYDVQCPHCEQEWFQYLFSGKEKKKKNDSIDLKTLAIEEYLISRGDITHRAQDTQEETVAKNVKFRISESTERLKKTKALISDEENKFLSVPTRIEKWTIIGFASATLIFIGFAILYIFNRQLKNNFPPIDKFLSNYKMFIDQIILLIQNFYNQISDLLH